MIIYVGGVRRNRIKFIVPLWVTKEDIDMIIEKLEDILVSVLTTS